MDRRLRGRPKRLEDAAAAGPTNASVSTKRTSSTTPVPVTTAAQGTRTRNSPIRTKGQGSPGQVKGKTPELVPRRSSRPRSTTLGMPAAAASQMGSIKSPTPIKEMKEEEEDLAESAKSMNSFPATLTTNTSTRAPNKSFTTSSVHSSQTNLTHQTKEINDNDSDITKLTDYLRRSVSKTISNVAGTDRTHTPTTNTDAESRYSRSVSRSVYDDDKSSKAEFSENGGDVDDEDDGNEEQFRSFNATQQQLNAACRIVPVPREFGGWIGATILMILAPIVIFYFQWSCSGISNACKLKQLNLNVLANVDFATKQIFKPYAVGAYVAFNFGVLLLSAILPGKRVKLSRDEYKFNASLIGLFVLAAAALAEYQQIAVADFILQHYLRFCIFGFINAFTVAIWSYIRVDTFRTPYLKITLSNEYAKSGNFMIDYALGRQLNPKWLDLIDFKQIFYRTSIISTLLFASSFLYKTITDSLTTDLAAIYSASMLLLYIADTIIFEHHLASSFELQHEGFGCLLLLRYAATPYLLSSVAKYFYDQKPIPISCCFSFYTAGIVLVAGLFIKRYSCAYKYKYRFNPQNPIFSNVETIHTYQSSRLLLSGLWGWVRQPNYFGDIVALLALGMPMFLRFAWPPIVSLLMIIALLLHRAVRANARNLSRYHSSWMRYCARVPYLVVPKIY